MTAPDGWEHYVERWRLQTPPLRPHPDVVSAIVDVLGPAPGRVLLLGATPELADIGAETIAVDWAEHALADIWPGDTSRRRAVLGDWRAMPLADAGVDAAIGDGSFNVLGTAEDFAAVIEQLDRVVRPGGRIVMRVFVAPDVPQQIAIIADDVIAGQERSFAAAKWRIAMALTDAEGGVAVAAVHAAFETLFPDRAALGEATGWSTATIAEIDAYRGAPTRLMFPTRARFEALARPFKAAWIATNGYPLAERCPLLVLER